jgi:diguanylate cyclase (GGDEF)-like protein
VQSKEPAETNEVAKPSLLSKLMWMILSPLQSIVFITLVTFIISGVGFFCVADKLYQDNSQFVTNDYQLTASKLANRISGVPSPGQILKTINQFNLSWYYITSGSGLIDPVTKPYAPDLKNLNEKQSRSLRWKGTDYFEVVTPISEGRYLHLGFASAPLRPVIMSQGLSLSTPVRIGYGLIVWFGTLIVLLIILQDAVSKPLRRLSHASSSLLLSRDAYSGVTGGGLRMPLYVATEVRKMADGLKDIRRQYDSQFFARIQKEEELKEQRKSHEITQDKLAEEYSKKIADTEQSLSEMHTREMEDDFVNALNRDIETLRSKHRVCQAILDRLNDKYPTSILHAAFFSSDGGQMSVDAFIGFEDRSLQALKSINHNVIAQELFAQGRHMQLGLGNMRNWGLQDVAQQLGLKSAVYFPLSFQGRNLGILGIYLKIEGQGLLDRIRVLRKVVDLATRHLYQLALYVEELESARTDPLTGLRNKKFFYEMAPQMFERALIDPENSNLSFILVDGDHFKQINDTFGHQVGDEVLRELAQILRACVRSTSDGIRPVDCLVRFGGEEFLVILENANPQIAQTVAERIRLAVEKKQNWPGGIASWTVSGGIATFPKDGKDAEQLLLQADTALYYVKHELGRNKMFAAANVPKTFKWAKTNAKISGELGVFEPATLLQALASGNKTGVLKIESENKQYFWMLFDNGTPLQARAGNIKGANAITELLTTFEGGTFKFQEQATGDSLNLEPSFSVNVGLQRAIMNAALAKDKFDVARSIISSEDAVLQLGTREEFIARWQVLKQLPDPPSEEELELMVKISGKLNGQVPLHEVFKSMDEVPTAVLWNAAGCLVQHGLVRQKVAA